MKIILFSALWLRALCVFAGGEFALSEHLSSASEIYLRFEDGYPKKNPSLHLKNGARISYADIVSLVDLYGKVGQSIVDGKGFKEQRKRFLTAFANMNESRYAARELPKLTLIVANELEEVLKKVREGKDPAVAFEKTSLEIGHKTNCITGGSCNKQLWWMKPGRYLKLLAYNKDHFAPHARQVYRTGHQLAIMQAQIAHRSHKPMDLEQAYAMEAFAAHYLSDLFASGHARTPRKELASRVKPEIVGTILSSFMHQEENKLGVTLINGYGESWLAFGDYAYFLPENQENAQRLQYALQLSADEVYQAYRTGLAPQANESFIPHAAENGRQTHNDITPMFYWDAQKKILYRRKNIDNPHDKRWTKNWWGWTTLIKLKRKRGLTPSAKTMWHKLDFDHF